MIAWMELGYYIIIWSGFGIIHTLFATNYFKSRISLSARNYRILYNIIVTIAFFAVLYLVPSISAILPELLKLSLMKQILFSLVFLIGAIIGTWGLSDWNITGFLGIADEKPELKLKNSFAFARHPVYTGVMIMMIAMLVIEISITTLSWVIGISGYFIIGSYFEEQKLSEQFGNMYDEYRTEVGRFLPLLPKNWQYLRSHISSK